MRLYLIIHNPFTGLQATKLTFNASLIERSAIAKSLVQVRTQCIILIITHLQLMYYTSTGFLQVSRTKYKTYPAANSPTAFSYAH